MSSLKQDHIYSFHIVCLDCNLEQKQFAQYFHGKYEGGPKSNENFSLAVGRMLVPTSLARCLH